MFSVVNFKSYLKLCQTAIFEQFPAMETTSLEELKALIEEEIYLIPEDREAILAQLESLAKSPVKTNAVTVQSTEKTAEMPVPAQEISSPMESPLVAEEPIAETISVRGNFSKGVLILHEEAELSAEVMDMLVKMINAVGHSMSEVGLVSSEQLEGRSMDELQGLNAHIVLKFGRIKHPINALPTLPYEVFSENETEYLFADSLSVIAEDKNLKKKLWSSLQVLFNLTSPK